MGQAHVANGTGRGDDGGPLYTTWREVHEKGSEELLEIIAIITGGHPPGIAKEDEYEPTN